MSNEEKEAHSEHETTCGFLRKVDSKSRIEYWNNLSDAEKDVIKSIPNFDKDIFKEITGIDVDCNSCD